MVEGATSKEHCICARVAKRIAELLRHSFTFPICPLLQKFLSPNFDFIFKVIGSQGSKLSRDYYFIIA